MTAASLNFLLQVTDFDEELPEQACPAQYVPHQDLPASVDLFSEPIEDEKAYMERVRQAAAKYLKVRGLLK